MKDFSIGTVVALLIIAIILITWNLTAYRDVEILKEEAPEFVSERGYKITSYDGYEGSVVIGGFVWYQARDTSGHLYKMAIVEWRGELQLYNLKCLNAITSD